MADPRAAELPPPNFYAHQTAAPTASEWDISDAATVAIYADAERRHVWFHERSRRVLSFLSRDGVRPTARVLEVGCGAGPVLAALSSAGYDVVGVEMHASLGRRAAEAVPRSRVYCLDVRDPPERFLQEGAFDAVGLFDVIEHVDDPTGLLRACARRLRPGGLLCGTVPALALLWSKYDVAMGHRTRYDRAGLAALLGALGLPAWRLDYFFQVLVPGLLVRALVVGRDRAVDAEQRRVVFARSLAPPGALATAAFTALFAVERWWHDRGQAAGAAAVAGTSLWFSAIVEEPARL